jgi:hypothetical protein
MELQERNPTLQVQDDDLEDEEDDEDEENDEDEGDEEEEEPWQVRGAA